MRPSIVKTMTRKENADRRSWSQSVVHFSRLKKFARRHVANRHAKAAFVDSCVPHARLLDVGCGNNSPFIIKGMRPDIYYVGLDVGDYNQNKSPTDHADEYITVSPEDFCAKIAAMAGSFDAVVSSHNIEHCHDPENVLTAMLRALRPGGRLFLSFPCEESVRFPKRWGTLNFFDDPTHLVVPNYEKTLSAIQREHFQLDYARKHYRPVYHYVRGMIAEPFSRMRKRVFYGTWAFYGFETVIWATRMTVADTDIGLP